MLSNRTRWLGRATTGALDLLFPANCLVCRAELQRPRGSAGLRPRFASDELGLCTRCLEQLVQQDGPACGRCAARVPELLGASDLLGRPDLAGRPGVCGHCRGQRLRFDRAFALGDYAGLLRHLVLAMKTERSEQTARAVGRLLALELGALLGALRPDAVVAVPTHAWRRLARGTNAPACLAACLARALDLPTFPGLLRRRRNIQRQRGLSQAARFLNVRGQMQVSASYSIQAAHVLLVDDILTTGATCSEAARMLKRAGAAQVTVVVAARTSGF